MRESIFDGAIEIKTIPHNEQRYDTVGDWWVDDEGWHIRVSRMSDWRFNFLVAFHELLECVWCAWKGVSQADVDAFDMAYEKARQPGDFSEPGDATDAPYREGHKMATMAEMFASKVLGVNWTEYENAIYALDWDAD